MPKRNTLADFWRWVNKTPTCWEWLGNVGTGQGQGYGHFSYKGKKYPAHRFSYAMANDLPLIFEGLVCHECDNPKCVRPDHLELGDHSKNIRDAYARGLMKYGSYGPRGEKNCHAKLTAPEVLKIKDLISQGFTNTEIAPQFSVTDAMICRIRHNRSWKHLNVTV